MPGQLGTVWRVRRGNLPHAVTGTSKGHSQCLARQVHSSREGGREWMTRGSKGSAAAVRLGREVPTGLSMDYVLFNFSQGGWVPSYSEAEQL